MRAQRSRYLWITNFEGQQRQKLTFILFALSRWSVLYIMLFERARKLIDFVLPFRFNANC